MAQTGAPNSFMLVLCGFIWVYIVGPAGSIGSVSVHMASYRINIDLTWDISTHKHPGSVLHRLQQKVIPIWGLILYALILSLIKFDWFSEFS